MLKKIAALIQENKNIDVSGISKASVLRSDLGMDSIELVRLASDVEDEFDIRIPDRVLRSFRTIGDVIDFIEKAVE